tara:strand:+ start:35586 stop:35840 length:255 start_codon:yes stop_codon:yes gene_type:complete
MNKSIKQRIHEELTKDDKSELKTYVISSKELELKIEKIIKDKLKNNRELEDMVVDITKNVLVQFHKALWVKKNFWTSGLSNKAS